jgi:predicted DNA-binding protein with PD1-like motif
MPHSFPLPRLHAASPARRWRSRSRNRFAAEVRLPAGSDIHEAMEKLATADDIAAAVRAAGHTAQHA